MNADHISKKEQMEEIFHLRRQVAELKSDLDDSSQLEYLVQVLKSGPLVILISRMRDDRILQVNDTFERIMGYRREDVIGSTTLELGIFVNPDDRERAARLIREGGTVNDFEAKMCTKSGEVRSFLTSVEMIEQNGEPCFLRMAYDITERKKIEETLLQEAYHRALHDPLTGLPNRALFLDRLGRSIERSKRREDYLFAVLFLDIDRLKAVNDSLGHVAGDKLLVEISHRLEYCLRLGDTVARLGGDEFAILLEDVNDVSDAMRVADRIQHDLTKPFDLNGKSISITASVGVTLSAVGYSQPEELLQDADSAMYRAKSKGGGHYEVYDIDMHARAVARLQLETDLLFAVKHQEFKVHFQPIVSLDSGKIVGFEALGRWYHPNRGLVSLAEFIPVAETTGLIVDIGQWMFHQACGQTFAWQERYPTVPNFRLNVNLSSVEFFQQDLLDRIAETLDKTGLQSEDLNLEITESVILEKPDESAEVLKSLKDLGVGVYIDDFGMGHSSLNVMYRYPINGLKIARSFVGRMDAGGEALEIVRTLVILARDFGMQVTAKGIETAEQLSQLRALRCPFGQGFYFSKPLDGAEMLELLDSDPEW
jgi:diguanylate cyclase (GGDEF)-like protein/PAS domain S-box-containing protein